MLSNLINGISLGSVYAIIALGYTMVYGIAKMLNFAHGDIIMVGGYVAFCTNYYLGWHALPSILLAVIVCTLLGIIIERLAYKPLRSAGSLAVLITAIGVSYFLQNAALLIWSSNPKSFPNRAGLQVLHHRLCHHHQHRPAHHCRLRGHHDRPDAVHQQDQDGQGHAGRAVRTRVPPSSWASTSTAPSP